MMNTKIVVYRPNKKESKNIFVDILERLLNADVDITYDSDKRRIDIGNRVRILFCSKELHKMTGTRCNFYDACVPGADSILSRGGAIKIDIFDFIDNLIKTYKKSENDPSQNPSVRP